MRKNIAILASGRGTNAENIIRYFAANPVAQVSWVLTNKEQAPVLQRAETWGVETAFFSKELWLSGEAIAAELARKHIDLVVLAGFLAKIPDAILHNYPDRIINIHPSLLPKFGGKGMYGDHVHQAVIAAA